MRTPVLVGLLCCATLSARAEDPAGDLGVVLFDDWPQDLPTPDDGPAIRWVVPGSPAASGGLKPGDIIANIDLFTVSAADLAARWHEKIIGAAGCIPMDALRTELKPKGWKHVPVCIPVKEWTLPPNAELNAAAQVPLAVISGLVEKPGRYLLTHQTLAQAIAAAEPHDDPPTIACVIASGPAPLPANDCGPPLDPKWKKVPKNRSYVVTIRERPPEAPAPVTPIATLTPGMTAAKTAPGALPVIPDGGR